MEVCVKTWDSLFCIKHKVYVKGVDAGFFGKSEVCIKAWDNTTHHPSLYKYFVCVKARIFWQFAEYVCKRDIFLIFVGYVYKPRITYHTSPCL